MDGLLSTGLPCLVFVTDTHLEIFLPSDLDANTLSLHPPHLIDFSGSLTPAALIPFCAYQTDMTLLGQTRQDLPFPVCDKFQPVVFEGQLCYSLDLATLNLELETKPHKEHGLLLLIDPSQSMGEPGRNFGGSSKFSRFGTLNMKLVNNVQKSASIHINTLGRFSDHRAGSYVLTTPKQMTGTQSFLDLSDDKKGCQIQDYEDCRVDAFFRKVQSKCQCIPWSLAVVLKAKVT